MQVSHFEEPSMSHEGETHPHHRSLTALIMVLQIKDEVNPDTNVIMVLFTPLRPECDLIPPQEMLAGETSQLRTQASALGDSSVDSEGNTILPAGLTQAHEETKYRPRIVDYACPYVEVCASHVFES